MKDFLGWTKQKKHHIYLVDDNDHFAARKHSMDVEEFRSSRLSDRGSSNEVDAEGNRIARFLPYLNKNKKQDQNLIYNAVKQFKSSTLN